MSDLVTNVFESKPSSVERVLHDPGRGFYIPSYQRPYAWKRDEVIALVEGVCEGLQGLVEMDDAITFLGSFIFINDSTFATVEPQVRQHLPAGVYLIIDGQQRLTTICMLSALLHDRFTYYLGKAREDWVGVGWMHDTGQEYRARLMNMIRLTKHYGDAPLYPRIIRAHADSWSTSESLAKYESPVAKFLHEYIKYAEASATDKGVTFDAGSDLLGKNYSAISRRLKQLLEAKRDRDDAKLPELVEMQGHLERFFGNLQPPEDMIALWDNEQPGLSERRSLEFCRLAAFTNYLLDRVAVTQVLAKKEDYAFDLFEALNTTGEPLTAYETFKPTVIKAEGLEIYQQSQSAKALGVVDAFLESDTSRRRQLSDRLLIPFALQQTGHKLGKHLRDQRNWLRKNFEASASATERHSFLFDLSYCSDFLTKIWPEKGSISDASIAHESDEWGAQSHVPFCMNVLRDSRHEITVAILSAFYAAFRRSKHGVSEAKEFAAAVRAVTAFFGLWRGSRAGTANIDAVHRMVMAKFKRRDGAKLSARDLRRELFAKLERTEPHIGDRAAWVARSSATDVYKQSTPLAKFLLLAAMHDARIDKATGQLVKAKEGTCPLMSAEKWSIYTVEHVAPQSEDAGTRSDSGYDRRIYQNDLKDTLGNLTLLPQSENSSVSDRPWPLKRLYYRELSAEVLSDDAITELREAGISEPSQKIIKSAKYLPHLHAVGQTPTDDWTKDIVLARGENLAALAWDTLFPWLDPNTT